MKICSKCKIPKELSEFFKREGERYRRDCKMCLAKYNRERYKKEHERISKQKKFLRLLPKHIEKQRQINREKSVEKYGISINEFNDILLQQNNCCKICGIEFSFRGEGKGSGVTSPQIDHDHACCATHCTCCGKCIRGLLCGTCNKALGLFHDNIDLIKKGLKYLEEYAEKNDSDTRTNAGK